MSLEEYIKNDAQVSMYDLLEMEKYYTNLVQKYNKMSLMVNSDILKRLSMVKNEIYRREHI